MTQPTDLKPDVMSSKCPSRAVLNHVTSKWGVLVLLALQSGKIRFSALRRKIDGVSERMLSQTLKTLEEDGFVKRTSHNTVPPQVDYCLTEAGEGVAERVRALASWVEAYLPEMGASTPSLPATPER